MLYNEEKIERERPKWVWFKYYISGITGSTCVGYLLLVVPYGILAESPSFWQLLEISLIFLPAGILAGFLGYKLDRKFTKSLLYKILFVVLTIILGFVFSFVPAFYYWVKMN